MAKITYSNNLGIKRQEKRSLSPEDELLLPKNPEIRMPRKTSRQSTWFDRLWMGGAKEVTTQGANSILASIGQLALHINELAETLEDWAKGKKQLGEEQLAGLGQQIENSYKQTRSLKEKPEAAVKPIAEQLKKTEKAAVKLHGSFERMVTKNEEAERSIAQLQRTEPEIGTETFVEKVIDGEKAPTPQKTQGYHLSQLVARKREETPSKSKESPKTIVKGGFVEMVTSRRSMSHELSILGR